MNAQLPIPNSQNVWVEAPRLCPDCALGVGSWKLGVNGERLREVGF